MARRKGRVNAVGVPKGHRDFRLLSVWSGPVRHAGGRDIAGNGDTAGKGASRWLARHWPRFLLIIPFALVAWVPAYNRLEPTFIGIPFFYWYQLAAILIGAFVVITVHVLERRIRRADAGPGPEDEAEDDASGSAGGAL